MLTTMSMFHLKKHLKKLCLRQRTHKMPSLSLRISMMKCLFCLCFFVLSCHRRVFEGPGQGLSFCYHFVADVTLPSLSIFQLTFYLDIFTTFRMDKLFATAKIRTAFSHRTLNLGCDAPSVLESLFLLVSRFNLRNILESRVTKVLRCLLWWQSISLPVVPPSIYSWNFMEL